MGPIRESSGPQPAQPGCRQTRATLPAAAALGNRSVGRLARAAGPAGAAAIVSTLARRTAIGNRATVRALQRDDDGPPPQDAGAPAGAPPQDAGAPPSSADVGTQPDGGSNAGTGGADIGPPPCTYTPKGSGTRSDIVAKSAALVPATEGEQKFYNGVSADTLKTGREFAAKRGSTYTDCIDWMIGRVASVKKKAMSPVAVSGPAWVPASAGMDLCKRPSPGDVFVMHSGKGGDPKVDSGNFAHTGVIKEVSKAATGGTEQWTSFDGGQGLATKLEHKEVTRDYDPGTNVFGNRWLHGWYDLDLLA